MLLLKGLEKKKTWLLMNHFMYIHFLKILKEKNTRLEYAKDI